MEHLAENFQILTNLLKQRTEVKFRLKGAIPGTLMISNNASSLSFFRVTRENGKRILRGIGRKPDLIYKLAGQEFNYELLKRINQNIDAISKCSDKLIDCSSEEVLKALPRNYNLLNQTNIIRAAFHTDNDFELSPSSDIQPCCYSEDFAISEKPEEWAVKAYASNDSFLSKKKHITKDGYYVRSKSEVIIFDIYREKGIPFHYDEVITLGNKSVSPDFILACRDGSLKFHEHLGLMDDEEYVEKTYSKLKLYKAHNIILGRNLLLTFDDENGNINSRLISSLIDDFCK